MPCAMALALATLTSLKAVPMANRKPCRRAFVYRSVCAQDFHNAGSFKLS